jgi:hypothetical protein
MEQSVGCTEERGWFCVIHDLAANFVAGLLAGKRREKKKGWFFSLGTGGVGDSADLIVLQGVA